MLRESIVAPQHAATMDGETAARFQRGKRRYPFDYINQPSDQAPLPVFPSVYLLWALARWRKQLSFRGCKLPSLSSALDCAPE
ncbi:unnamed protein product [Echinostoma caproni]|uniref:Transposase n=1 Tax=Echinostoma caproni TaxID=27848 RepID=A0A183AB55_9TREM|nr:unnamed protein product [Echinostoma caproni]